jgi:hypothetical protein
MENLRCERIGLLPLDEDGVTHVLRAGPEFHVIGKNALGREMHRSSSAMAGGALFIRGVDHICDRSDRRAFGHSPA